MMTCRTQVTVSALAAVLLGGCLVGKPPANPTPSIFFVSGRDLDTLVARAAAGAGCPVDEQGPFGSGSTRGAYRHEVAGLNATLRCDAPTASRVLQALRDEVQTLAQQKGAQVIDAAQAEGPEGRMAGFTLNYGAPGAHGKVEGNLQPVPPGDKPGEGRYRLRVQIEEWSGG